MDRYHSKTDVKERTLNADRRNKQQKRQNNLRIESRRTAFDHGRNIENLSFEEEEIEQIREGIAPKEVPASRMAMLKKFKEEKALRAKQAKKNQKPAFKTGIVHHSIMPDFIWTPLPSKPLAPQAPMKHLPVQRVGATTRTMTKQNSKNKTQKENVFLPISQKTKFKAPAGIKKVALTIPNTPNFNMKTKHTYNLEQISSNKVFPTSKSLALVSNVPSTPKSVARVSSTEPTPKTVVRVSSAKSTPKSVARVSSVQPSPKSVALVSSGSPSTDVASTSATEPVHDVLNSTFTLNPSEEHDAAHFSNLLNSEIARLNSHCAQWEHIKLSLPDDISEDVSSLFDLVIGQTRLLIRSKFVQFQKLIVDCEKSNTTPLVRCEDLAGFWDMLTMQIVDLDKRFQSLAKLQDNNWIEILPIVKAREKRRPVETQINKKCVKKSSSIHAMIRATKKKQLEEEQKLESKCITNTLSSSRFSELKSTPECSNKRRSILLQVLGKEEARKVEHSSPIIMKVGLIERKRLQASESDDTVAKPETPCKSVLKFSSNLSSHILNRKSVKFGVKDVFYLEDAEETQFQINTSDINNTLSSMGSTLTEVNSKQSRSKITQRKSYRCTPYKTRRTMDGKSNEEEFTLIDALTSDLHIASPVISKAKDARRSKEIMQHVGTCDLISFDTPIRRSKRLSSIKD